VTKTLGTTTATTTVTCRPGASGAETQLRSGYLSMPRGSSFVARPAFFLPRRRSRPGRSIACKWPLRDQNDANDASKPNASEDAVCIIRSRRSGGANLRPPPENGGLPLKKQK